MQKELSKNYQLDLEKSKSTPLLIELAKKDIEVMGDVFPLVAAQNIYDMHLPKDSGTNIISIEGNSCEESERFYLVETLLEKLSGEIKDIKSIGMLKEGLKTAASIATAGVLGSIFGSQLEKGVDFVIDELGESVCDVFIDAVGENIDISDAIIEKIEDKMHDLAGESLSSVIGTTSEHNLNLSHEAKKRLDAISDEFKASDKENIFYIAFKLMITIGIESPKLIFVNNPHKLDLNSIALISLLLSYAKYQKDQDKHTGLSFVYMYSDEKFQPYSEAEEIYKEKKELLDEQRRFSQRYSMLERPSSDIPKVAIKSSMFVGRVNELQELKENFNQREKTTISSISGEPGIGKTALTYRHLKSIQENKKMIQLTLLNEAGHSSSNTGISSLQKSILEEAQRLELLKSWTDKGADFIKSYASTKGAVEIIGSILGVDKVVDVAKASWDRLQVDDTIEQAKQSSFGDLDNKQEQQKEQQFTDLDNAIKKLQNITDDKQPLVLFIDDIQWIDELSSEYILTHLSNNFELYMVATLRPSDASTKLKKLQESQTSNEHAIALLKALHVKNSDKVDSNIDIAKLNTKTIKLKGFDKTALNELLTQVIKGKQEHLEALAQTIIKEIGEKDAIEVNTLFAIETINMLCDEKLYSQHNQTRVILDNPLRVDESITDIAQTLKDTFESIKERYKDSLSHYEQTTKNQHFNLAAYAVLEERLHILKLYFAEHGNAAVNTLLFSSLLGAPFSSNIVKNVLQTLSNTEEPLLEPLKAMLTKDAKEINLTKEHYAIIDEVYEILSRYVSYDSAYMYRHSLLHIFLDRQLDYMLETTLKESQQEAKDKMFELIIKEIKEEKQKQDFYGEPEQSLDTKKYANMLFFRTTEQSVLKKAYEENPTVWAGDYTRSLNNLAVSYKNSNQLPKAIELQKEALEITKELYGNNPDVWAEAYTTSLNNLASSYQDSNQLPKAIELEKEALEIRKELYENNPTVWAGDYTRSLNNLAVSYYNSNQLPQAIELQKEALEIRKELYENNPTVWADDYTTILNNLASSYKNSNQLPKAIELQKEALEITKELYGNNPDVWAEAYTTSLNNLASSYQDSNQLPKAIELQKEALEITKELYENNPTVWAEDYTGNLNNLAFSYQDSNQLPKAIELQKEALEITRELYENNPTVWAELYTTSLNNLATSYKKSNQFPKAIELEKEALEIIKELYENNPTVWADDYTTILNNLASSYKNSNQLPKAIELQKEALEITKELYGNNPDVWAEDYTGSLNNLAFSYQDSNQLPKAIELEKEALEITKELYENNPTVWAEAYTRSLNNLAASYYNSNQLSKAIELEKEALEIRKELYGNNPTVWAGNYTTSLNNLATSYKKSNQFPKAIELEKEALEITKELYGNNPDVWAEDYTGNLNNLASSKAKMGDFKEAGVLLQQYFDIYNFEQQDNIVYFMYPFIKWYQCEMKLNNQNNLDKLDALGEELKTLYKKKLGDSYISTIEKERKKCMDSKNSSEDSMVTERYDIFVKLFVEYI